MFERQVSKFKSMISKVVEKYSELQTSEKLDAYDKNLMISYRNCKNEQSDVEDALLNISECLEKHYGEKVMILIDEYDVPL